MFNHLSIKIKYSIPLAIALVALITVMLANFWLTSKLESSASVFPEKFMPAISVVLNADRDLYQARVAEIRFVTADSASQKHLDDFNDNAQQAKDRFNEYRSLMKDYPDVLAQLKGFNRLYDDWLMQARKSIRAKQQGNAEEAASIMAGASEQTFSTLRMK